jgi:heat shock protein HslJ
MRRSRLARPAGTCCAVLIAACAATPPGSPAQGAAPGSAAAGAAAGRPASAIPAQPVRWTVGPSLTECVGVGPMWCLLYRDAEGGPWKRHYGPIEGFEFRPGDETDLWVRFEAVARPPADASSRRTLLVREIERRTLSGGALPAALAGTRWRLEAMPERTAIPTGAARGVPTLGFEEGARVSGESGVNRFGARVDAGEGWLRVSAPMLTRMAGPPEAMALEAEFLGRLGRAGHWRVDGDRLRLLDAGGGELMSLRRLPPGQGS